MATSASARTRSSSCRSDATRRAQLTRLAAREGAGRPGTRSPRAASDRPGRVHPLSGLFFCCRAQPTRPPRRDVTMSWRLPRRLPSQPPPPTTRGAQGARRAPGTGGRPQAARGRVGRGDEKIRRGTDVRRRGRTASAAPECRTPPAPARHEGRSGGAFGGAPLEDSRGSEDRPSAGDPVPRGRPAAAPARWPRITLGGVRPRDRASARRAARRAAAVSSRRPRGAGRSRGRWRPSGARP